MSMIPIDSLPYVQNFLVIYCFAFCFLLINILDGLRDDIDFSADACSYLNSWTEPLKQLKIFAWAMLTKTPRWKEVQVVMTTLEDLNLYDANENAAKLHCQYRYIRNYCTDDKIEMWKNNKVPIQNRWVEIFKHLQAENCEYKEIAMLVEYILCLPGTTASVERVFSAMAKSWTAEKTRLHIETLKAILTVKCNLQYSCIEFYTFLKTKPELLRSIAAKDKYKMKTRSGEIIVIEDDSDANDDNDDDGSASVDY